MLTACRILIVEDNVLIAEEVCQLLMEAEAEVLGPALSIADAKQLMKLGKPVDAALLDVNLTDGKITPVLDVLRTRHVPMVVYTGGAMPEEVGRHHQDLRLVAKPVSPARLVRELKAVMEDVAHIQSQVTYRDRR
jgi:DNA-binding response OmpR family regulator